MKYRILTTRRGRWGEGWQYGDVVELDVEAAKVPLQLREIEPISEYKEEVLAAETPKTEERMFVCDICEKVCKNEFGLKVHRRSHK